MQNDSSVKEVFSYENKIYSLLEMEDTGLMFTYKRLMSKILPNVESYKSLLLLPEQFQRLDQDLIIYAVSNQSIKKSTIKDISGFPIIRNLYFLYFHEAINFKNANPSFFTDENTLDDIFRINFYMKEK